MKKWWDGELQMLDAVPKAIAENKNIVVTSGLSLGKDYICGGLVPYLLEVWGPCIVINTARRGPADGEIHRVRAAVGEFFPRDGEDAFIRRVGAAILRVLILFRRLGVPRLVVVENLNGRWVVVCNRDRVRRR